MRGHFSEENLFGWRRNVVLTVEQKQYRVLTAIYKLSKGIVGAQVRKVDLLNEINESGIMLMGH